MLLWQSRRLAKFSFVQFLFHLHRLRAFCSAYSIHPGTLFIRPSRNTIPRDFTLSKINHHLSPRKLRIQDQLRALVRSPIKTNTFWLLLSSRNGATNPDAASVSNLHNRRYHLSRWKCCFNYVHNGSPNYLLWS